MLKMNDFFVEYCETWNSMLMLKKTKIVIFPKGPDPKHTIKFNDEVIEIVKIFYYLRHLCDQTKKSMYGIIRKI